MLKNDFINPWSKYRTRIFFSSKRIADYSHEITVRLISPFLGVTWLEIWGKFVGKTVELLFEIFASVASFAELVGVGTEEERTRCCHYMLKCTRWKSSFRRSKQYMTPDRVIKVRRYRWAWILNVSLDFFETFLGLDTVQHPTTNNWVHKLKMLCDFL